MGIIFLGKQFGLSIVAYIENRKHCTFRPHSKYILCTDASGFLSNSISYRLSGNIKHDTIYQIKCRGRTAYYMLHQQSYWKKIVFYHAASSRTTCPIFSQELFKRFNINSILQPENCTVGQSAMSLGGGIFVLKPPILLVSIDSS